MNLHESSTDQRDAARLRDELDAAVQTLDVPTDRLTAAARRQGRVVRRRRRLGTGMAAIAAMAVIGVGGGQVLGSNGAAPDFATDTSPDAGQTPSAVPPEAIFQMERGWWSMPVAEMGTRLRSLLPADITLTDVALEPLDPAPGEENREVEGLLRAVVESPTSGGPGEIEIFLRAPASAYPEPGEFRPTDAEGNMTTYTTSDPHSNRDDIACMRPSTECTPLLRRDGRPYGVVYASGSEGATYYGSHVLTDDEGLVQVVVSDDTSGEKWSAPVTADRPALTVEQVRAIAEDPTWQDWTPPADD
ncbi:MAG: hypothetical protein H0X12_03700 [Nocardioides sp.]|nr:hypothetical protein [Nocardioides sp.]